MKMHEAKDNVKFLYTLDRFFRVMEKSSPVKLYLLFVKKQNKQKTSLNLYSISVHPLLKRLVYCSMSLS